MADGDGRTAPCSAAACTPAGPGVAMKGPVPAGTDRPTIGLMMIVRNEAAVLPRLAASVRDHIDYWTVVDTGSTDNTVEVAGQVFAGKPGQVLEDEWKGFGPSRNVALGAAEPHTDWLLALDADHTLHGELDGTALALDVDALDIEERYGELRYWLPRLLRAGRGWHWKGRTHEYVTTRGHEASHQRTSSCWVEHLADGGSRASKFHRDIDLLSQDWQESPDDPRTAFYMARTYDDLGEDALAVDWYRRRRSLGGWDEERFYSAYRAGACLLRSGATDEGCGLLWRAWGERPWRSEPLVELASHYRRTEAWGPGWLACQAAFAHCGARPLGGSSDVPRDSLFVDAAVTRWRIAYEASICAWYVGERRTGRSLVRYLLDMQGLPRDIRQSVESNSHYYETGAG